jgi:hypothetical protein
MTNSKGLKSLRDRAKEFSTLLPLMENREKGDVTRLLDTPMTIIDYGFLIDSEDGQEKDYVCFIVKEDPQNFYFGGQVLTDNMHELEEEGYHEAITKEGLPVLFSKKKSKNKREYTTVSFYPEN